MECRFLSECPSSECGRLYTVLQVIGRARVVCGYDKELRTLPANALFLMMRVPSPYLGIRNESTKQTHTAFFMAGSRKKFILFHLSCPCVRQSPRILYEGFNLSASSAGVSP